MNLEVVEPGLAKPGCSEGKKQEARHADRHQDSFDDDQYAALYRECG